MHVYYRIWRTFNIIICCHLFIQLYLGILLKVRALTASLEASLMARQGIKKPAGAVDIHATEDTEDMSDQRTQV